MCDPVYAEHAVARNDRREQDFGTDAEHLAADEGDDDAGAGKESPINTSAPTKDACTAAEGAEAQGAGAF